ncbi:zinc-binding dehydrogenase [Actinophytocola algeriensis]|uniref:NADPH:quinone reductase-like Zn-dependent oxidoreductase n=1 Tax=Actinophytocola algeriensis TaxID=1768010 RepID=A0A7W7VES1_9PSEU|nr:zinc-binding dehydrogenase [Actinophytocola algeriensis]MBB4907561.1 NADPH:quinone reductase-like Zn-dependent oxidoreductase [Actinophytocola algeriensis]MBE1479591.1 NADPH:quinone reductase-like Zn-dependent oxidoreductase [Actinophytocola algeriensis]
MRAVVLSEPGPVTNLSIEDRPVPEPPEGWVRIRVRAFGLNRSELHTRLGLAEGVTFPRVPGIECVGEIDSPCDLPPGQQVATMMGNMGRTYDGGYAEYTVVPRGQVIPFTSDLPWPVLGAVPETLQTAYGSLTIGVGLSSGGTVLIRGGTSSVGLAAAALAVGMGATVLSTTRSADRLPALEAVGVAHPLVDDGNVAAQVRARYPSGVDGAVELVGTPTLPDTLAAVRVRGTVCFTGMLSNEWIVRDFYPIGYLPKGVRLTGYGGEAGDLPAPVLQKALDDIAAGRLTLGVPTVYALDDIRQAHDDMEHNRVYGKQVVSLA